MKKRIILFSTLNPFPFWAGSENFWFDFVTDEAVASKFSFTCTLAKSPVTCQKGQLLKAAGAEMRYYEHFNVSFAKRNIYRFIGKITKSPRKILPWYKQLTSGKFDLVWFNVAALEDLLNLSYPVSLCRKKNIPYYLILQHGFEDFFLTSEADINTITEVARGAKRFIFIADRNRHSLERAIGVKLENAVRSFNAIPHRKILQAREAGLKRLPSTEGKARFFNLGRFSPRDKAQHLLVQVFSESAWKTRDWQLSFIGVADFGQYYIRRMMKYFGLDVERVKFIPFANDVFQAIGNEDVLLMPSVAEGTPYAMVESMASARPALGTPVGGIPELIVDGRTGWLARGVQAADVYEKLEEAWKARISWPQYGTNAQRNIMDRYDEEYTHRELVNLLQNDLA